MSIVAKLSGLSLHVFDCSHVDGLVLGAEDGPDDGE